MLGLLQLADVGVAAACWALACVVDWDRGKIEGPGPFADLHQQAPWMLLSLALVPLVYTRMGLYEPRRIRGLPQECARLVQAVVIVWAAAYVPAGFLGAKLLSRITMGALLAGWVVLGLGLRLSARLFLRWSRRRGYNLRHAAIVGTGRLAQELYHALGRNPWTGLQIKYFLSEEGPGRKLCGLDVLEASADLCDLVARRPVDIVFVALPGERQRQVEEVLSSLAMTSLDVRVVADTLSFHLLRHEVAQLDELSIIEVTRTPQAGWNSAMKRLVDLAGSAIGLAVLAAPMALVALAIKLTSRGPAFYWQTRSSLDGKPFRMVKFRTMIENAEAVGGPVWAKADDQRTTKLGRLLRRTSLDELPQLLNVLLGQMSLVGPRPERPEFVEQLSRLIPRYTLRHHVKAGLTGWAQIHGYRGRSSLRKRIQYDLYYVANWSLGLDLWILLLTPLRGLVNRNAY
jgi:exopolysaccharide biosynthesis polyprenyl glycosylphosphotransferase